MLTKKSLLIAGAITTISVAGIGGASAFAMSSNGDQQSLASVIAQKFNLSESDVKGVINQYKLDRQKDHDADRQAKLSDYLQKMVDKGKITAEQKTLIETKLKEMKVAFEKEQSDVKAWAETNNIDLSYVRMHKDGSLQKLVDSGKITAEQKSMIEAKQAELKKMHDDAQSALKQWLNDNNIDEKYLMMDKDSHHGDRHNF